jgi:hypothetical protein
VLEEGSLCDRVMDSERNLWVDLGSQLVVCTINQQYNLVQHQLSTGYEPGFAHLIRKTASTRKQNTNRQINHQHV